MTFRKERTFFSTAAVLAAVLGAAQQPFDLDPSFRTTIQEYYVASMLPLSDGKVITSGMMRFPSDFNNYTLVRLNADGSKDGSFNNSGLGGGKITLWNDGRFYVGTYGSETVRRIMPDGQSDISFISMNNGPYFSSNQGGDYYVYPDGRVLMTGRHYLGDTVRDYVGYDYSLIWFSNQGYLDTTAHHRRSNGAIYHITHMSDDKFILSGEMSTYEDQPVGHVIRVEANGDLDPTFQSDMIWGSVYCTYELPDHKLLVAGNFRFNGETDTLHLVRLLPDGSRDPTFNNFLQSGYYQQPGHQPWRWIHPLDERRLIVTGNFNAIDEQIRGGIALVDTAGQVLDELFAANGCGPFELDGLITAGISGIVEATDGSFYIYGAYYGYNDGTINDPQQRFVSRLYGLSVGVQEHIRPEAAILRLYPDPATTQVTLEYDLKAIPKDAAAVVCDMAGREHLRVALRETRGPIMLDIGRLPPGAYTVQLLSGGVRLDTEKLVIQP